MYNNIIEDLARKLMKNPQTIEHILQLLHEGNTIHFLARYRKEQIGGIDEEQLRFIEKEYLYQKQLIERKNTIKQRLKEQDLLTETLIHAIDKAEKLVEIEQLYEPYKSKKMTKAKLAIQGGLEPLAKKILAQDYLVLEEEIIKYINSTFPTGDDVLKNTGYLIAQKISENLNIRQKIKQYFYRYSFLKATAKKNIEKNDPQKIYEIYYEFNQKLNKLANHQVLALNRAEKAKVIQIAFQIEEEQLETLVFSELFFKNNILDKAWFLEIIKDALKRLIIPSVQREIRTELTQKAETEAIVLFGKNVYQLLMQKPLKKQVILGLDPAFRTGCKLAVINGMGDLEAIDVIYPHEPKNEKNAAKEKLIQLYNKHHFSLIAIGNGTASRESEQFIATWIQEENLPIQYTIVNESGASVYSASKLAIEEFPDLSVEQRSAASIARRIQDPLAELVKIDPKSLGVGQYQHDLSQKFLDDELKYTVDKAVNVVGVDVNSASRSLLTYISGLNKTIAENIIFYRQTHGYIKNRNSLLKIKGLGKKAFEQAAGFLRIIQGDNIFDNTAIHPESYKLATIILNDIGFQPSDIGSETLISYINDHRSELITKYTLESDNYTLNALFDAFTHPFRDVREQHPAPILKSDIQTLNDLVVGMELEGTIRNITDFGAFIDIGLKNDAFVHISKMSPQFLHHPSDVVSIGDIKTVYIENIDEARGRVEVSLLKKLTKK